MVRIVIKEVKLKGYSSLSLKIHAGALITKTSESFSYFAF
jgi:hypothetical protein